MNEYVECLLKPIVWVLWYILWIAVLVAGLFLTVEGERMFWKWNWIVALTLHAIVLYLFLAGCLANIKWPWK